MNSDAMNKPSGVSGWVNVIVLPDNGNASYVSQLLISSTGVAYVRGLRVDSWTSWQKL